MFKTIINKLILLLLSIFLASPAYTEEKPKSLTPSYSDGGSIFSLPVFEPEKIDFDINSKYQQAVQPIKKPIPVNKKPAPKSLKPEYSGGFIIKKEIEPEFGFYEATEINEVIKVKEQTIQKLEPDINKRIITFKPIEKVKILKKPVIVIDPGHGGKDPGAIGKLGTKEKQITFLYSVELKKELERTGKYKVILTRYGDDFVPLKGRVKKARKHNGDIMISIHADSISNNSVRGFSVYTISDKRVEREAGKLLIKSGSEDVIRGVSMRGDSLDVKEAIIDFAQKETKSVSDSFSKIVAKHLGQKVKPLRNANREKSLAVLTGADIPSVLIELGYLSNSYEERLLRTKDHRKKIVKSIKSAIDDYFREFEFFLE